MGMKGILYSCKFLFIIVIIIIFIVIFVLKKTILINSLISNPYYKMFTSGHPYFVIIIFVLGCNLASQSNIKAEYGSHLGSFDCYKYSCLQRF